MDEKPEPTVRYIRQSPQEGGYYVDYPDRRYGYETRYISEAAVQEWEQNPEAVKDALCRVFEYRRRSRAPG